MQVKKYIARAKHFTQSRVFGWYLYVVELMEHVPNIFDWNLILISTVFFYFLLFQNGMSSYTIGHLRVPLCRCFKASLSKKPSS